MLSIVVETLLFFWDLLSRAAVGLSRITLVYNFPTIDIYQYSSAIVTEIIRLLPTAALQRASPSICDELFYFKILLACGDMYSFRVGAY